MVLCNPGENNGVRDISMGWFLQAMRVFQAGFRADEVIQTPPCSYSRLEEEGRRKKERGDKGIKQSNEKRALLSLLCNICHPAGAGAEASSSVSTGKVLLCPFDFHTGASCPAFPQDIFAFLIFGLHIRL